MAMNLPSARQEASKALEHLGSAAWNIVKGTAALTATAAGFYALSQVSLIAFKATGDIIVGSAIAGGSIAAGAEVMKDIVSTAITAPFSAVYELAQAASHACEAVVIATKSAGEWILGSEEQSILTADTNVEGNTEDDFIDLSGITPEQGNEA